VLHHATASVAVIPPAVDQKRCAIPKLSRILAATDFSDLGNKAIPYACAMVPRGANLKLLHVVRPGDAVESEKNAPRPGKENPKLLAKLRALVPPEGNEHFDVNVAVVESDDIALAIVQEAERFDADAICVGSHGRTGLAKSFLGSVAQAVMAKSRRPVFVVRGDEK